MKSKRVAIIKDKSPIQTKTFEIRKLENGLYELNLIYPSSYNFGTFGTPDDCKKKAHKICPLGIKIIRT